MTAKQEALSAISRQIWEEKYRYKPEDGAQGDSSIEAMWRRVSAAAAAAEAKSERTRYAAQFYDAMADFGFLPAGRILAGAGTSRKVTLFNCFVMGRIEDDMASIFENVKEAALTMQQGGGIGHDFSTLRPRGALVKGVGADASGPVSFMDVWDAMCRTIMSAGSRRGAMMGTLRCDHPDIEDFVAVKADPMRLRNFNLSVLVTDAFMEAVKTDADWPLQFEGKIYKTVPARALWDKIMRAAYDYAEPGVIFIDRVNRENSLSYCETISATNPCGEQPLPPHGACLLGSINLARLIKHPFEDQAALDEERLETLVPTAVRFLDNIISISRFPLAAQEHEAKAKRRIGLGITGLADALILCGKHYGSPEARALAKKWMARIETLAYLASAELAEEKGAFALFDKEAYLKSGRSPHLSPEIRKAIKKHGLRNGLLTSIAPTGTISLFADNVSSGIEPVFDFVYQRRILEAGGGIREETVEDYAYRLFRRKFGYHAALPDYFVTAQQLAPSDHVAMQAAIQPHVDSSISKTVNCPADIPFDAFKDVYAEAYAEGLKGCTAYRPNTVTGAVLVSGSPAKVKDEARHKADDWDGGLTSNIHDSARSTSPSASHTPHVLARDPVLAGFTYKLKWPESDHAIYVTINDIIDHGQRRPFEIFINSKNLEHYAWTVALTRMISAVFRRGGDVSFVVEELKVVFDPRGGHWLNGRYVPSLLAAIGGIIEKHMIEIGFIKSDDHAAGVSPTTGIAGAAPAAARHVRQGLSGKACPRCGFPSLVYQEGCYVCRQCGYSKCS